MSELVNVRRGRTDFRRHLLIGASAVALTTLICPPGAAAADDEADHPAVWIELGGQFEQTRGLGDPYAPPFSSEIVADGFMSPLKAQRALSGSFGEEGAVSFQPEVSGWTFSAAVRYGRAQGGATKHEQTKGCPCHLSFTTGSGDLHTGSISPPGAKFSETQVSNSETQAVLDFQAGKDIGLGLFGRGSQSTINFGVRFAQFDMKQHLDMHADPDRYIPKNPLKYAEHYHTYAVTSHIERSFRGLGPSLSWNASAPLIGNPGDGEIAFDLGVNAAVLFGRQRALGHHQTIGTYHVSRPKYRATISIQRSGNLDRSRSVAVPNAGGFAGLSMRYSNAKINLGYRADFFFGAIDDGIDLARKNNIGFYGPFATVSIDVGR